MAATHSNIYFTNKIKAEQKIHNIMKINKKITLQVKKNIFPFIKNYTKDLIKITANNAIS